MTSEEAAGDPRGPGWRELAGTFGWQADERLQREPSGRERNGSQPDEGARDLALPTLGKMQGEAAGLAGDASGEGEEAVAGGSWWLRSARPGRAAPSSGPGCGP